MKLLVIVILLCSPLFALSQKPCEFKTKQRAGKLIVKSKCILETHPLEVQHSMAEELFLAPTKGYDTWLLPTGSKITKVRLTKKGLRIKGPGKDCRFDHDTVNALCDEIGCWRN